MGNLTNTTATALLNLAGETLSKDRNILYGDAQETLGRIGEIWGAIQGTAPLPPHLVAAMMVGLKLIRGTNSPTHEDNWVDAAAYAALAAACV